MHSSTTHETAIFEQVHDLLQQQAQHRTSTDDASTKRIPRVDARKTRRRPYQCSQLLAPYHGDNPPAQSEFKLVRCRDLSPGGFAFYTNQHPTTPQVVIALGLAPFSFFVAQILRVQESEPGSGAVLLVGCKFLYRLGTAM